MMATRPVVLRSTTTRNGLVVETEHAPIIVGQSSEPVLWLYRLWVLLTDGSRVALTDQRGNEVVTLSASMAMVYHDHAVDAIERSGWPASITQPHSEAVEE